MPQQLPPLTERWIPLRDHPEQLAYQGTRRRFVVVPAGRRSGKTERAKRRLVHLALLGTNRYFQKWDSPWYFAAAPTRDQAKRIYWEDLKRMVPKALMLGKPSESQLTIPLHHGGGIAVVGLDKPERLEGSPWVHGVVDEFGNVKPQAWKLNIRPALSDRNGSCDFIGVPEGRNHYYDMFLEAQARMQADPYGSEWGWHHWVSADILDPAEIAQAREDLDELSFKQEYEASFVTFAGRAYYSFDSTKNCAPLAYNPHKPLILCFDFNVDPGVAVVAQEMILPWTVKRLVKVGRTEYTEEEPISGTGVIGEVRIELNSNTPMVCRKLINDWGQHQGRVLLYGDATGGNRGTAKVMGSDWDIIQDLLRPVFGQRLEMMVRRQNPLERSRVNAMNSRLCSAAGVRRICVDPTKAPWLVRDLDGVRVIPGSNGELDKRSDPKLTHLSDALGYYVAQEYPVGQTGSMPRLRVSGT